MSCPPSTLSYKDRLRLAEVDAHKYKQLYSHGMQKDVFARLQGDATGRIMRMNATGSSCSSQGSAASFNSDQSADSDLPWPEMKPTSNVFYSQGTLSGFMSNTSRPATTKVPFKAGFQSNERVPLESLPKGSESRFKQCDPLEYFATVRPQAETTNQTMRMLGTFTSDVPHAKRVGSHIPHGVGVQGYHPDVRA